MKRTKFLALVLVVAIMMMGAGYAAWQETLTINHTVSTGNVDVDLSNGTAVVFENDTINTPDGLEHTPTVVGSEQEATVTLTNLYPGAKVVVTIPVKNNSTMPVKYESTTSSGVPDWLTVSDVHPTGNLSVKGDGNIVVTMLVGDGAKESPEHQNVQFKLSPVYVQWNK